MSGARLAIVDDEQGICNVIGRVAEECGFDVFKTTSPSRFLFQAREMSFDVIVLDLHMPGLDGIDILRELSALSSQAQIVLASGMDGQVMDSAIRLGRERRLEMVGTIHKPIRIQDLRRLLRDLVPKQSFAEPAIAAPGVTGAELMQAISRDELVLHYQPQLDLATNRIVGVEALIRWQHPALGLLPPLAFLPLAESTGLIVPVTNWLYDQAIAQCGDWFKQGMRLRLSLNLSPKLPFDYDMAEHIAAVCDRYRFQPDLVTLELSETTAMDDPIRLRDALTRLRIKGFNLSVDDFGTAYSSLVELQRLPFTELKIDKSLVTTMLKSKARLMVVETIVSIAHNMHMNAMAEGIETADVLEALIGRRCDLAQGYFISHPVPADQIPDFCYAPTAAPSAAMH